MNDLATTEQTELAEVQPNNMAFVMPGDFPDLDNAELGMSIDNLKSALPEFAKDLKLNLGSISRTTVLTEELRATERELLERVKKETVDARRTA